ncbi:alginate O-acetyltransferase AlgF [Solimonas terrae]|uniref:Alginate biosynthesis protein AlgF n=1 Tax=Solimonas terrae TaxID=1396819 RepID=A0A6M2BR04_9GAMM|nr:alginate O-acetyltransferase AlgF [Solimonas terrae]NGY04641.1 alginate O-acetyltransferase [Solimonas terrae]
MNKTPFPIRRLTLPLATALAAAALQAQAGLYPPAAPPDSAFVRVFNDTTQGRLDAQLGDKRVPDAAPMDASSYVFLPPGRYDAKIGGKSDKLSLETRRCYTAALTPAEIRLFDQACFNSQLKSLISVYNLVDGTTLTVKAGDNGPAVVDAVAANAAGHREVNPVKASLVVFNGDTRLAAAKPVTLERGKVYSLFVTGTTASPVLTWVVN